MTTAFDKIAAGLADAIAYAEGRSEADAERHRPPKHRTGVDFLEDRDEDVVKPVGPLEDIYPVVLEEDREAEFDPDEVPWWELE